jgi:hypothetical protein
LCLHLPIDVPRHFIYSLPSAALVAIVCLLKHVEKEATKALPS